MQVLTPKEMTKSNFGSKGWAVVIFAFFCWTVAGLLSNGMNVLYGYYEGVFGWTRTSMALYVSVGNWASIVIILLFGIFANKLGAKNMLIIGLVGCAISFAGFAFISSLSHFAICYIGFTMFAAAITGFGIQFLGSNWFPKKKGLFMGWATMGVILAASAVNAIIVACLKGPGVQAFFWGGAVLIALMLVYTIIFVRNYPEELGAYPDNDKSFSREQQAAILKMGETYKKTSPWTVGKILRDKYTWTIVIGWGLLNLTMNGVFGQIVPAFMSFGHSQAFAVNILTYSFPVGFFFSWMGGWWDSKWGTKHASRWMVCGMNIIGCTLLALGGQNAILAMIGIWFFMGANSAGNNMTMSVVANRFGRYDFANGWTVISVLTRLIQSAGAVTTSLAGDLTGSYKGAFLILAGVTVVAFLFMSISDVSCVGRTDEEIDEMARQVVTQQAVAQAE